MKNVGRGKPPDIIFWPSKPLSFNCLLTVTCGTGTDSMLSSLSGSEALLTMTQTMTTCSAFEHFMNGNGAI